MKIFIALFTSMIVFSGYSQNKLIISQVLNNNSINIYKEATCINKIGEISRGDYVFVLDKTDNVAYRIYRNGVTGYIAWNWLKVWQIDYPNLGGDIDSKIALAKIKEIEIDQQRQKDSILNKKIEIETGKKNKKQGINISELEYIDGRFYCGFNFTITNYSDRTIKYLYLTVAAYNPVNDYVATKRFTYVGPVQSGEQSFYKSDLAFNQNAIDHFKIKKIVVQYMNGSTREYIGKLLKEVVADSNY